MKTRALTMLTVTLAVALAIVGVVAYPMSAIVHPGQAASTGPTVVSSSTSTRSTSASSQQSSSAPSSTSSNLSTLTIPKGATKEPPGFNVSQLVTGGYDYPYDLKVVIGVNNTVEWMNADTVEHTVSSFVVPSGAETFNSDLIQPGGSFSTTLSVPGQYKYACMWHPWIAGVITVLPPTKG